MKFGKRLKRQIEETLPEWRDKFLSYKDLKQLVRQISADGSVEPGKAEAEFIDLLDAEIDKFNLFFVEQEEDFIIRQKELHERIRNVINTVGRIGSRSSEAEYMAEMGKIRKEIVNFHGEMVLLENYSNINYTGLAKILKKYDKRTGRLLRLPFIETVLKQPFFTTDLISKLVKECESTMDVVFPVDKKAEAMERKENEEAATTVTEPSIFRNTIAALATMHELRRGSSTYGHFSLPPLNVADAELPQALQFPSPIPIQ